MFKTIGLGSLALGALLLVGCGGGGSKSTTVTSISQVTGIWDLSETEDGITDVDYLYIANNGDLIDYDYLGDSADEGPDCYDEYDIGTLTKTGDDTFQIQFNYSNVAQNVTASLNNDTLKLKDSNSGETESFPKASVTLEEIQSKLCENM